MGAPRAGAGSSGRAAPRVLRDQQWRKIFRIDQKTSPCTTQWEVLRPRATGRDLELFVAFGDVLKALAVLQSRPAALRADENLQANLFCIGVHAAAKAVEKGDAAGVLMCGDGVPKGLVQHLPVMCSLRGVPVAILGITPAALADVFASAAASVPTLELTRQRLSGGRTAAAAGNVGSTPAGAARRATVISAVALRRSCVSHALLGTFCEKLKSAAPAVTVPFLIPASGVPSTLTPPRRAGRRRRPAVADGTAGRGGVARKEPLTTAERAGVVGEEAGGAASSGPCIAFSDKEASKQWGQAQEPASKRQRHWESHGSSGKRHRGGGGDNKNARGAAGAGPAVPHDFDWEAAGRAAASAASAKVKASAEKGGPGHAASGAEATVAGARLGLAAGGASEAAACSESTEHPGHASSASHGASSAPAERGGGPELAAQGPPEAVAEPPKASIYDFFQGILP